MDEVHAGPTHASVLDKDIKGDPQAEGKGVPVCCQLIHLALQLFHLTLLLWNLVCLLFHLALWLLHLVFLLLHLVFQLFHLVFQSSVLDPMAFSHVPLNFFLSCEAQFVGFVLISISSVILSRIG